MGNREEYGSLLDWVRIDALIDMALAEDLGDVGDATTLAVVPKGLEAAAALVCRERCVCAGLPVAARVFAKVDASLQFDVLVVEGGECPPGTSLATIRGAARSLLTAERTALNFLQRLCGVATTAANYAAAVAGTGARVLDTRKTTPGWRLLEKYAVAMGGATNHRVGLYDRIMVKDNHRELAGLEARDGIALAVRRARAAFPELEVEVEADTLDEARLAIESGAEHVLLDNMTLEQMAEAVAVNAGRAKLEASGGVTIERLRAIAELGIDFISVGALTHSVKAIDISMEIKPLGH